MRPGIAVVLGALVWGGCDSDSAKPAAPPAEVADEAAKSDSKARDAEPASKPDAEAKAQPDPNRPAKDMEDPDNQSQPDPAKAKPAVDPSPGPGATLTTVEANTPAAKAGKVAHNVGIALPGGRIAPALAKGCALPCWQPLPMWPKTADDTSVDFTLRRATGTKTSGGAELGTFRVGSVPKPPAGTHSEVIVGLGIVDGAIAVHAKLRDTGEPLPLSKVEP